MNSVAMVVANTTTLLLIVINPPSVCVRPPATRNRTSVKALLVVVPSVIELPLMRSILPVCTCIPEFDTPPTSATEVSVGLEICMLSRMNALFDTSTTVPLVVR